MSNLFIIGNGFDIAHGLPTKYADFKKYLSDRIKINQGIKDNDEDYIKITEIPSLTEQKIWCKKGVCAEYWKEERLIYWLIDEVSNKKFDMKWSDFETYLSELNIHSILEKWGYTIDNAMKIQETICDISGFFFRWINTIDLSKVQKKSNLEKIIRGDTDFVLSFNYTETLERIYGVCKHNICHIHGTRETNYEEQKRKDMVSIGKDYCNLIIGYEEKLLNLKEHNLLYSDENIRNAILIAKTGLIKDVDQNIFNEKAFFENIEKADIQNIYSVGLSYSNVDMPYIREICDRIRKSKKIKECMWYFEEYDSTERRNEFKRKITEAGYNGSYAEFRM